MPALLAFSLFGSGSASAQVAGAAMTVQIALTSYADNDASGNVTAGDVLTFTETATNTGSVALTNVYFQHGKPPCPSVSVGASCVSTFRHQVTTYDADQGRVERYSEAVSTELPNGVFSPGIDVVVFGGPAVTLTEALTQNADGDHSGTVTPGDVLTYTITAVNTGGVALSSFQILDFGLAPNTSTTCNNIAIGGSCTLTIHYTVTAADAVNGQIVDSAYVFGLLSNNAFIFTPVKTSLGAGMTVSTSTAGYSADPVVAGTQIRYVATATNSGDVPLTNVQISSPQTTPGSVTCASVAVAAACTLATSYTVTTADLTNRITTQLAITVTSKEVPGPINFGFSSVGVGSHFPAPFTSMQIVTGNAQAGPPGATLPVPLTIQIQGPAAVSGQPVDFYIVTGDARVVSNQVLTDAQGMASTQLVLGTTPGAVVVQAGLAYHAPGVVFTEAVTGTLPPATLAIVSGNNQPLLINQPSAPLVVQLTRGGAPVPNATISWSGSNVALANATTLTDSNGRSSNTATKRAAGTATITAMANSPSFGPVTFGSIDGVASVSGLSPQQLAIAHALDHACPALAVQGSLTPAQQDLLQQCLALSAAAGSNPSEVANALNQMLPHDALLQTSASILVTTAQFDNIKARLAALRSGSGDAHFGGLAFSTPDGTLPLGRLGDAALGFDDKPADTKPEAGNGFDRWGFFAAGTFSNGSADPRQATPGYGFRTNGVTAGVDYRFSDAFVFGVSAGFARYSSNVDVVGGGLDSNGWSLSAYSTLYRKDNWYTDGVLTWSSNNYDITRRIVYALTTGTGTLSVNQTATSSSSGNTLAAALTLGRDFSKGPWSFGPYLRGTWSRTNFDGYQEALVTTQPGNGLGLAIASRDVKNTSSVLGAKLNYTSSQSWGVLMPHAEVEWEHDFESSPDSITAHFLQDPTATPFQLKGDPIDTNFFRLGLGLSFQMAHGRSGFIYYEKTLGLSGITQNNIALGFRMEF